MRAVERMIERGVCGPRRSRAFTLIEVIVALVVVSLGMLAVIQAVGQTAGNSGYLRDKTVAHWVAMNRLTETRLQKAAPSIDKTSDEVEMGGQRWKWTMNVTQTPIETIRRIDISVRPAEAREDSSLASVSGFYGTAIAPPGSALIAWQGAAAGGGPQQPGANPDEEPGDDPGESPGDSPGDDEEIDPRDVEEPFEEPIDPGDPSDPNQ